MELSENRQVVEVLKRILLDYDYLEYDENESTGRDELCIKVIDLDAKRDSRVPAVICLKLEGATNRQFSVVNFGYDFDDPWEEFVIALKKKDE